MTFDEEWALATVRHPTTLTWAEHVALGVENQSRMPSIAEETPRRSADQAYCASPGLARDVDYKQIVNRE